VKTSYYLYLATLAALGAAALAIPGYFEPSLPAPPMSPADYPSPPPFNGRVTVWILAQLHILLAAFVLGVPVFAWIVELAGVVTGEARYDRVAREFMSVATAGYALASFLGGGLTLALVTFYPRVMLHLAGVFGETLWWYAALIAAESALAWLYYSSWERLRRRKTAHLALGLMLNLAGTALMALANSWVTFMMAPSGVGPDGARLGGVWEAMAGPLWNPLNVHRFFSNVTYGGALTAAYAACRFLAARDGAARAHYDWMGCVSFVVAMAGLLPLPFAGYWLTKEIYDFSQQMGVTLMGGAFGWLFVLQAALIGVVFLAANYYLWISLGRAGEGSRFHRFIQPLAAVVAVAFLVWFTPHSLVTTPREAALAGGPGHPLLGPLGLMAAKNTAVNILILATFFSFQLFYRVNLRAAGRGFWARHGAALQTGIYAAAAVNILALGIYSYYTPVSVRVGLSVPQVATAALTIVLCVVIDGLMFRQREPRGGFQWGAMPRQSQYALILIAVTLTWIMGLMGYCRSAIRESWHIYGVLRDASPDAYTPTLAWASWLNTGIVAAFLVLAALMFWAPARRGNRES